MEDVTECNVSEIDALEKMWAAYDELPPDRRLEWIWESFGEIIDECAREWGDDLIEQSTKELKRMKDA